MRPRSCAGAARAPRKERPITTTTRPPAVRHPGREAVPSGGVFSITAGQAAISGLAIRDGKVDGLPGAGVRVIGATAPPTVALTGVVVADNRTQNSPGGGGLYVSNATVTI